MIHGKIKEKCKKNIKITLRFIIGKYRPKKKINEIKDLRKQSVAKSYFFFTLKNR